MVEKFTRTVKVWNRKTSQHQDVTVAVMVDVDGIASELAYKALHNKSKVSAEIGGKVTVAVREVHVPKAEMAVLKSDLNRMFNPKG